VYKPFIPYEKKQKIVEEYRCSECPWGYFETWEEEVIRKMHDSEGKVFELPGKIIFFRCKNPEHEYLISVNKI
ncbi:MAG: hypothetical protein QW602_02415, partial [Candidatus Aenigmatarchaeota archaeon]